MKKESSFLPPINIFYILSSLQTGGPILQYYYLISNIDKKRFRPLVIVTTFSREPTEIENRLIRDGVHVINLRLSKLRSLITAPFCLRRLLKGRQPFVVHPYGFRSDLICTFAGVRPRLSNVRDHLLQNYRFIYGIFWGRIVWSIHQYFIGKAQLVVSCSEAVKRDQAALGQISVAVRNAISLEIYQSFMCSKNGFLNSRHRTITYVTVSSALPGKNIQFLVREFGAAPIGQRRLVVIGRTPPELVASYRHNPNIDFRGHVSHPGDVLLEAHYFLSASEHEGMPNAVLEALALGRPVALSQIPSHVEVLDVVGHELGVLFTWTANSLWRALEDLEAREYSPLSTSCANAARTHLGAAEMARRYEKVYLGLAGLGDGRKL